MMLKWLVQFFLGSQSAKVSSLSELQVSTILSLPLTQVRAHTCMHLFAFVQHILVLCLVCCGNVCTCMCKIKLTIKFIYFLASACDYLTITLLSA